MITIFVLCEHFSKYRVVTIYGSISKKSQSPILLLAFFGGRVKLIPPQHAGIFVAVGMRYWPWNKRTYHEPEYPFLQKAVWKGIFEEACLSLSGFYPFFYVVESVF